jgi:transposase InsO family protein
VARAIIHCNVCVAYFNKIWDIRSSRSRMMYRGATFQPQASVSWCEIHSAVTILVEARPNARWSLDFVHDQFANGRRFRILNIVDDVTKECLGAIPDTSISGRRVARELTAIVERRGRPGIIVSDHGTEFTCNTMLAWCKDTIIDCVCTGNLNPDLVVVK